MKFEGTEKRFPYRTNSLWSPSFLHPFFFCICLFCIFVWSLFYNYFICFLNTNNVYRTIYFQNVDINFSRNLKRGTRCLPSYRIHHYRKIAACSCFILNEK